MCIIIFCSNLTANLFAQRVLEINIFNIHAHVTGGVLIFGITFMILDLITEVYGPTFAKYALFFNIFGLCFFAFLTKSILSISPAAILVKDIEYQHVIGTSFLTLLATTIACLVAGCFNCFVLNKLKLKYKGRFFWARSTFSTSLGEIVYSFIWVLVFFNSRVSISLLSQLIVVQVIIKILFEIFTMPISYLILYFISLQDENLLKSKQVKFYE